MPIKPFGRGPCRAAVLVCALLAGVTLNPKRPIAASDAVQQPVFAGLSCVPKIQAKTQGLSQAGAVTRLSRVGRRLSRLDPIRILAIGSSSTQGVGASSPARSYPARLEADLKARWPKVQISVTNAGIGGETADITVARLERLLATQAFDLVIWQLGTNDAVHGDDADGFRKQALRGIAAGRAAGVDLFLLDPQYFPGIRDLNGYERYVSIVKEVGDGEHVAVFQRYAMMKFWGAQGEAGLLAALSPDQFHMNDKGYGCLAEALTAEIGEMSEPASVGNGQAITLSAKK